MRGSREESDSRALYVTTSWDDGAPYDRRLSDLLLRYGVSGTFYIAKHVSRRGLSDEEVTELGNHFEVGGHGVNHLKLGRASAHDLSEEIYGAKAYIEDLTGRSVTSFAYPYGSYNPAAANLLGEAGFTVGRTTRAFSEPWADKPLEQGVTLQVARYGRAATERQLSRQRGTRLPELLRLADLPSDSQDNVSWTELALMSFNAVRSLGGVWHLWGHSWEIEQHELWSDLEIVLANISAQTDIRFVTNREIRAGLFCTEVR